MVVEQLSRASSQKARRRRGPDEVPSPCAAALVGVIVAMLVAGTTVLGVLEASPAHAESSPAQLGSMPPVLNYDAPDPTVIAGPRGRMYAYTTNIVLFGRWLNIPRWESVDDGATWSLDDSDALPNLAPWQRPDLGFSWAPGILTRSDGLNLLYYSGMGPEGRMCIGVAQSWDLAGSFGNVALPNGSLVCQTGLGGSIDPDPVMGADGFVRLLFKSDENAVGRVSRLWSLPLAWDGVTWHGQPRAILAAERPWEHGLIENPSMTRVGSTWWLSFSGGDWASSGYATGLAKCAGPDGPCTRTGPQPWLSSTGMVAGPGGGDFYRRSDGSLWTVFAAWNPVSVGYGAGGARRGFATRLAADSESIRHSAPFGEISVDPSDQGWELSGWVLDPDTAAPIDISVTVGGVPAGSGRADRPAAKVSDRYPDYGAAHGFHLTVPAPPGAGRQEVCVRASDVGGSPLQTPVACTFVENPGPVTGESSFVPIAPVRVLDTRNDTGGHRRPWGGGETSSVAVVGGSTGVPPDATAVAVNVTVTEPSADSYLSVFPSGTARPSSSSVNFRAGQTVANGVTVAVGASGKVDVFALVGSVHVVIDVVGYFTTGEGSGFVPMTPERLLDSRTPLGGHPGAWTGAESSRVKVAGVGSVPRDVVAVALNVTVTEPTFPSYLSVYPGGFTRPTSSTLNFLAGETVANSTIVGVGADGGIDLFNHAGATHVVVDVVGYFTAGEGASFVGAAPTRILDSRTGLGGHPRPWQGDEVHAVQVVGVGGVPKDAIAVVLNVTVTEPTFPSYLSVYPAGVGRPPSSTLNFPAGQTVANGVTVAVGASGAIEVHNFLGSTHVLIDVVGYYVRGARPSAVQPDQTTLAPDDPVAPGSSTSSTSAPPSAGAAPPGVGEIIVPSTSSSSSTTTTTALASPSTSTTTASVAPGPLIR